MTLPPFVEKIEDYPHLVIVRLKNHIDASTLGSVSKYFKKPGWEEKLAGKSVLFDLKNVGRVDTAAVAQFIDVLSKLNRKKLHFAFMNAPAHLENTLEVLKLREVFLIFDSERAALREIFTWSKEWR